MVRKEKVSFEDLKPGMKVMHDSWNLRTSEPCLVVKMGKKIGLKDLESGEVSDIFYPDEKKEDDCGWIICK